MRLKEWLEKEGKMQKAFAKQVGVSSNTITKIVKNNKPVRLETAVKIERATKGQVKVKDLLPEKEETDK